MKFMVRNTAIKRGGRLYPEGSTIELSDDEAKPLEKYLEPIDSGLQPVDEQPAADSGPEPVEGFEDKKPKKGGRK